MARERRGGGQSARSRRSCMRFQRASLVGAFLIGLSTFQAEFDFGVPQFDFLFEPMLIMLAASVALVAARLWAGRGGALHRRRRFSSAVRGGVSRAGRPGVR